MPPVKNDEDDDVIMGRKLEEIHPVREVVVCPSGGSAETWWLAAFAVLVVVVCTLAVGTRTGSSETAELQPWQMNAFTALNANEQGTFNALYTSAMEIDAAHEEGEGEWMDIHELEQLFIPPFARDAAWRRQGRIRWTHNLPISEEMDMALYLGIPEEKEASGSFLLVMLHGHARKQGNASGKPEHARYEVWHHASTSVKFPAVITDQALIASGWKEVVALKGSDEIRRVKGESIS